MYFLLDGIDEIPEHQRQELEEELRDLQYKSPEAGILLAFRKGEVPRFANLNNVEIRSMSDRQFGDFLEKNKQDNPKLVHLHGFLGVNDKPISRYLRNPYLLTLIHHMTRDGQVEVADIKNFNLQQILQAYVKYVQSSRKQQTGTGIPNSSR
jgi:hypothetical protein